MRKDNSRAKLLLLLRQGSKGSGKLIDWIDSGANRLYPFIYIGGGLDPFLGVPNKFPRD
jgi:hypothetical protein